MLKNIISIKTKASVEAMPGALIGERDWASFVKQVQEELVPVYNLEKSLRMQATLHDKMLLPLLQTQVDEAMSRLYAAIRDSQNPTDPMEVLHRAQHSSFQVGDEKVRTLLAFLMLPMIEAEFQSPPGKNWADIFLPKH